MKAIRVKCPNCKGLRTTKFFAKNGAAIQFCEYDLVCVMCRGRGTVKAKNVHLDGRKKFKRGPRKKHL